MGMLQERVSRDSTQDMEELNKRLVNTWRDMKQSVTDMAIDQWRIRLSAFVRAEGRQFEHLLAC